MNKEQYREAIVDLLEEVVSMMPNGRFLSSVVESLDGITKLKFHNSSSHRFLYIKEHLVNIDHVMMIKEEVSEDEDSMRFVFHLTGGNTLCTCWTTIENGMNQDANLNSLLNILHNPSLQDLELEGPGF